PSRLRRMPRGSSIGMVSTVVEYGACVENLAHSPCCVSSALPAIFTSRSATIATRANVVVRYRGYSQHNAGAARPITIAAVRVSSGAPPASASARDGHSSAVISAATISVTGMGDKVTAGARSATHHAPEHRRAVDSGDH